MDTTIIYTTDYSEKSVTALKYANFVRKAIKAKLVIINVLEDTTFLNSPLTESRYHLEKPTARGEESKLIEFCKKYLQEDFDESNIILEAVEDKSVVNGILSRSRFYNADLIITGNKGKSAVKEYILGNTSKRLIEKASVPVLTIPEDATHHSLETLVYATDFQDEDVAVIEKLIEFAQPFNATIKIVHITNDKEYDANIQMEWLKESLRKKISYNKVDYEVLFSDKTLEKLRVYLGDVGADMVAMMEKNKTLFDKIIHNDLVLQMESYGRIPLLSYNRSTYELVDL